jgi:hypothetical protein
MAELLKISYSGPDGLSEADEFSIKAILSMCYSGEHAPFPSFSAILIQYLSSWSRRRKSPFPPTSLEDSTFSQTVSTIRSFVLAMICYPEIQRKAQQVIHDVVGDDRMPDFSDKDQEGMVYIDALLMEVMR